MLLIESSSSVFCRSSAQGVLKKKEPGRLELEWQGSESCIGRKCDIFRGLEQVHKKSRLRPGTEVQKQTKQKPFNISVQGDSIHSNPFD